MRAGLWQLTLQGEEAVKVLGQQRPRVLNKVGCEGSGTAVITIIKYNDIDDAISLANNTEFGRNDSGLGIEYGPEGE